MKKTFKYKYVEISIEPKNKEDNEKLRQFLNSKSLFFIDGKKIDDYLNSREFLEIPEGQCKFIFADENGISFLGPIILYEEINRKNNKNFVVFTNTFNEFKEKYLKNFIENKRS